VFLRQLLKNDASANVLVETKTSHVFEAIAEYSLSKKRAAEVPQEKLGLLPECSELPTMHSTTRLIFALCRMATYD